MIYVSRYIEHILDGEEVRNIFGDRRQSVVNQKKEDRKEKKTPPETSGHFLAVDLQQSYVNITVLMISLPLWHC